MNKFWIRLFNNLNCEIDATLVEVPEGEDPAQALRETVIELIKDAPLEPGDSIRIGDA